MSTAAATASTTSRSTAENDGAAARAVTAPASTTAEPHPSSTAASTHPTDRPRTAAG